MPMESELTLAMKTPQAETGPTPKFGYRDVCCLKSNRSLVGHVAVTPDGLDTPETLADIPHFRYTEVPEAIVNEAVATGVPPRGYVFVVFVELSQGCSLVHENDLELIDRLFDMGDPVERFSSNKMRGQVISTATKCTLEPIVFRPIDSVTGDYLSLQFTEKSFERCSESLTASETLETNICLLFDVPQSDLKIAEELSEDEHIVYQQKVGVIHEVERDTVILLPNSKVVSLLDSSGLELPVYANPANIISKSDLNCHDMGNDRQLWSTEADFIHPGQSVLVKRSDIDRVDWPSGNERSVVQGYVLATPAENVHVEWLCPNVFSSGHQGYGSPNEVLRASVLRADAVICDFELATTQESQAAKSQPLLDVGDRVRLRDPVGAKTKYPGYQHILPDQTYGHDLNVFRVVATKTELVVQWQDGSRTSEAATSLRQSNVGNDELWPGNIVVLKDSVENVSSAASANSLKTPYHSMYRESETLRVQQIGIVQKVDSEERIASVRWFQSPDVGLTEGGNTLVPGSFLGRLGDAINCVSIYELATFPALSRFIDDLVIVAPETVDQSVMSPTHVHELVALAGSCREQPLASARYTCTFLYLVLMKAAMITCEWFRETTAIRAPSLRRRYSVHNNDPMPPVDFFGKIVGMDINGAITVRFPGPIKSRDVQIPFERILMVMPKEDMLFPLSLVSPALPSSSSYPSSLVSSSVHNEVTRVTDIMDDGWITDDDSSGSVNSEELDRASHSGDDAHGVGGIKMNKIGLKDIAPGSKKPNSYRIINLPMPSSAPPSFAVLEDLPPFDHHFTHASYRAVTLAPLLKRIRKEFQILETSLPPGIFVRSWESRLDLLRVLIIGPEGTPYEYAPFVIDMHFTSDFPYKPPSMFFHSWAFGQGPINPNLYEDGKICLSILGTWPTQNPEETWSPTKSTILQILVSIMGLVLVKTPFYNEAGYEAFAVEDTRHLESSQYTEKVFVMTRRFILHALENPIRGLEDALIWHYLPDPSSTRPGLLHRAIEEASRMIEHYDRVSVQAKQEPPASLFCSRLSLGAVVMLKKHVNALKELMLDASAENR
ncbi:hypothetical protein BJY04DRAFT_195362 [Aspergillus karnatakaensis]|uniref:ubiquitin-conjugating enzyme E2 n=1 Tax=Aspergillus karnatakaensis TaxID=1810916 RepID=UPI003CCE1672